MQRSAAWCDSFFNDPVGKIGELIMNQFINRVSMPPMNRVIAAPRSDMGRFVSDAEFRVDHYFCNRLNVAPVGTAPKTERQKGETESFTLETDPRPFSKSRMQDACFATVAAASRTEEFDSPLACSVLMVSESPTVQANHADAACDEPSVVGLTMAELEKLAITQTLERCAGNRTRAARMLGVSVRTLQRKLNSWKSKCA